MALLQTGSKGPEVVELQKALNKFLASKGSPTIKEDGDFGNNTKNAVIAFQTANGLKPDGIVGDMTWGKLRGSPAQPSNPVTQPTNPGGSSGADRFAKMTAIVIAKLEGGYYHPDMNSPTGRLKKYNPLLASSGETMFGIDRLNGAGALASNPAWNEFWGMIDQADARTQWGYNYTGGPLQDKLTTLAIAIMAPYFEKLSTQYLKTNRAVVMADNRLIFHFAYATWNGPGWFKKFANDIDNAVKAGKTGDALADVAIWSRTKEGLKPGSPPNALLVQTGNKIAEIFKTLG